MAGRAHRHRERLAVDPELERLLDGDEVGLGRVRGSRVTRTSRSRREPCADVGRGRHAGHASPRGPRAPLRSLRPRGLARRTTPRARCRRGDRSCLHVPPRGTRAAAFTLAANLSRVCHGCVPTSCRFVHRCRAAVAPAVAESALPAKARTRLGQTHGMLRRGSLLAVLVALLAAGCSIDRVEWETSGFPVEDVAHALEEEHHADRPRPSSASSARCRAPSGSAARTRTRPSSTAT